MKAKGHSVYNQANGRAVHFGVFLVMLLMILLHGQDAHAANVLPDGFRVGTAIGMFENTSQVAALFPVWAPRRLRARHLELALGVIDTSAEANPGLDLTYRFDS